MTDKIILKVLKLMEDDRRAIAREREVYVKTIKDLTDKLYFLQDKQGYIVNKVEDNRDKEVVRTKEPEDEGIPLQDLPSDMFEEAIRADG